MQIRNIYIYIGFPDVIKTMLNLKKSLNKILDIDFIISGLEKVKQNTQNIWIDQKAITNHTDGRLEGSTSLDLIVLLKF